MAGTIVIGYDGSDHGADAIALGRRLARLADARIVVAHAYPEDPLGEGATALALAEEIRGEAERTLARAREELGDAAAELRPIAARVPSTALHELAEEVDALAIVVGATHHGTALRLLAGSTPERVLDHAPCPVAVAPEGFAAREAAVGTPARIAVALDDSPEAAEALAFAAKLARADGGTRLRLVTAVNPVAVGMYPPVDLAAHQQLLGLARDEAVARLQGSAELVGDVPSEIAVLDGDPVEALLADASHADAMVVGSHRRGALSRVLLGSVSRRLLRDAACPVVVVPRGSEER